MDFKEDNVFTRNVNNSPCPASGISDFVRRNMELKEDDVFIRDVINLVCGASALVVEGYPESFPQFVRAFARIQVCFKQGFSPFERVCRFFSVYPCCNVLKHYYSAGSHFYIFQFCKTTLGDTV